MYCSLCNKEIPDHSSVCPYCGVHLSGIYQAKRISPQKYCKICGKEVPNDATVCPYCGVHLEKRITSHIQTQNEGELEQLNQFNNHITYLRVFFKQLYDLLIFSLVASIVYISIICLCVLFNHGHLLVFSIVIAIITALVVFIKRLDLLFKNRRLNIYINKTLTYEIICLIIAILFAFIKLRVSTATIYLISVIAKSSNILPIISNLLICYCIKDYGLLLKNDSVTKSTNTCIKILIVFIGILAVVALIPVYSNLIKIIEFMISILALLEYLYLLKRVKNYNPFE